MDAELNRRNTLDAVDAFNAGDLDRYLASYAPYAVIHGLPEHLPPTVAGHREFLTAMRAALPDFKAEVHTLIVENDTSAARLTYTGTHRGVLQGVPPTGRRLRWDAMNFRRFNDEGLTVERWILNDNIALLHQLGRV
ncbi:ester cyclase [Intrasporangium oryzae NRRL B-24470]|uniref:Ester cyclase n=1 Tax=Intrasporangium oryzae NRRL B-24470 TaxID=1386089 RepID=W9G3W9_9MICO|nr:ester cyclase [Intrasporangium oryzae]EWT00710.1 ester cyclase [Intrasporangium oryzae NRRL B-24470]